MTSQPDPVREFAPAKINLFLHVGERRTDGFHDLQSLAVFAGVGDELTFEPVDSLSLVIDGPFAKGLEGEADNLVLRAARALAAKRRIEPNVRIGLRKNLPVASGIGGGSTDAAASLRGLNRLWNLKSEEGDLRVIAEGLGSDVPVCLSPQSQWMEGRGERVSPAPSVPSLPILLINPGVGVPTGPVFAALRSRTGTQGQKPVRWGSVDELIAYLKTTRNDLEAPARSIAPAIGVALDEISNASGLLLARMSGSGATCFGLFENNDAAARSMREVRSRHPKWWIAATQTSSAGQ